MVWERLKALLAMLLIGDGAVAIIAPRRLSRFLQAGPEPYQRTLDAFIERPGMTRLLSAGQVAFGIWLALRQLPR